VMSVSSAWPQHSTELTECASLCQSCLNLLLSSSIAWNTGGTLYSGQTDLVLQGTAPSTAMHCQ
jgi:hypothetical protein